MLAFFKIESLENGPVPSAKFFVLSEGIRTAAAAVGLLERAYCTYVVTVCHGGYFHVWILTQLL